MSAVSPEPEAFDILGWRTAGRQLPAAGSPAAAGVCSPAWEAACSRPLGGAGSPPAAGGNR